MPDVFRAAIVAFIVTRTVFFALTIVGSQIAFERKGYQGSVWETRVIVRSERLIPELTRVAMSGDAWFYRSIALDGYTPRHAAGEGANWPFFPLFPLLTRLLGANGNFAMIGMAVSNIAFLGALVIAGALATATGASVDDAKRAIWYMAVFPTSYFCSLPLPEGLFLLLSSGSFLAAVRGRWAAAAVLGALAAATRFVGLLLVPVLLLVAIERGERLMRAAPWTIAIAAGTGAFMLHLHAVTGSPIAFITTQAMWGRKPAAPFEPLIDGLAALPTVSVPWNFVAFNFAVALLLAWAAIALLKERRWSSSAYTFGSLLVPLSTGSLQSLGRYAAVVFPLFLYLAIRGRSGAVDRTIFAVSLMLFGWFTALFVLRVDFALA